MRGPSALHARLTRTLCLPSPSSCVKDYKLVCEACKPMEEKEVDKSEDKA